MDAGAMPGGNNTSVPSFGDKKKKNYDLPSPSEGQNKEDFVSNCMSNDKMQSEFPDEQQRLAVCYRQFGEPEQHQESLEQVSYEMIPHVPIFKENENVDLEQLQNIVRVNNERFAMGEKCAVIVGHNNPGEEKPAVGFASNFELGERRGTATIFADFEMHPKFKDFQNMFPSRSVEHFDANRGGDDIIYPISLLGGNRPALDLGLGLVSSYKTDEESNKYQYEDQLMDREELINLVLQTLDASPVGQYVQGLMRQPTNIEAAPEPDAQPSDPNPAEIVAENQAAHDIEEAATDQQEAMNGAEDPESVMDDIDEDAQVEAVAEEELKKKRNYSAMEMAIERYQKALVEKDNEIKQLASKYTLAERKSDLLALAQVYTFNLSEEVEYVKDLSAEHYAKHINLIRTRYSKAPVGKTEMLDKIVQLSDAGGKKEITKDDVSEIVKYATQNQCSFQDALSKYSK